MQSSASFIGLTTAVNRPRHLQSQRFPASVSLFKIMTDDVIGTRHSHGYEKMSKEPSGEGPSGGSAHPMRRVVDRSNAFQDRPGYLGGDLLAENFGAAALAGDLLVTTTAERFFGVSAIAREVTQVSRLTERFASTVPPQYLPYIQNIATQEHQRLSELMRQQTQFGLIGGALSETMQLARVSGALLASQAYRNQFDAIGRITRDLQNAMSAFRAMQPSIGDYAEQIRRLPARVKENLVALAEAGWYLDSEMPLSELVYFKEELASSSPQEVDEGLADYFREALDRIEDALIEQHPNRAALIGDAFAAHRQGKFNLSIPLLFAQADGICFDLTGYQLFSNRGLSRYARRIDPDTLERAYLEPLLLKGLTESAGRRSGNRKRLNRHAVLHGESTDYGCEKNGLKAISFLNFVSHALSLGLRKAQHQQVDDRTDRKTLPPR